MVFADHRHPPLCQESTVVTCDGSHACEQATRGKGEATHSTRRRRDWVTQARRIGIYVLQQALDKLIRGERCILRLPLEPEQRLRDRPHLRPPCKHVTGMLRRLCSWAWAIHAVQGC